LGDFTFYEFFCGGGMARAGLGPHWTCLFANDFDAKKAASYALNWGAGDLVLKDVGELETQELPGQADLAWASFPCQDLSLAGMGAGLAGDRSGAFWPFWRLMRQLHREGRAPPLIVLENVCGALTSHGGADFRALCAALSEAQYRFGAVVVDAIEFVPQSRPRLFLIAATASLTIPSKLLDDFRCAKWVPSALREAHRGLSPEAQRAWAWWRLPEPPRRNAGLADLIEEVPSGVCWRTPEETGRLLSLMSEVNLEKVDAARKANRRLVGAVYRRTRHDRDGGKVQRAEVRFDDIAGCLRTPAGGSSRQSLVIVEGTCVRSRLLSAREAARLMGLPDTYQLPARYNDAYHLVGDGVVVPVVRHLAEHILEPILRANIAAAVASPPRRARRA
jgi:DNA (cytosine-5)-methyltransferase 1